MNSTETSDENGTTENGHTDPLAVRDLALTLLHTILDQKTAIDIAFDRSSVFAALENRDRRFVRMLVTTTLRRLGQIDDLIQSALNRPDALNIPMIKHILRLGVAQIFFMHVADHAAVDTSVSLAEHKNYARQKGFVNGVLRTLIRSGRDRLDRQDSGRMNAPEWLLRLLIEDYGLETTGHITNAHLTEAPLDMSVKNASERVKWVEVLDAEVLETGSLRRVSGGNVTALEGFDEGAWWVQDAAAAIPATLFGDIRGKHVVDLCAAPGGKTLQLCAQGANVTAVDRSTKRLKRLHENIKRMGFDEQVDIITADAGIWSPPKPIDHILLDAPCSATGTLRRHPDTAYLKSDRDIDALMVIQKRILSHAATLLPVGGVMVYCTCSLQKSEGEHQISAFLKNNSNFKRQEMTSHDVGGYDDMITDDGDARILPHYLSEIGGMDGFYIARLVRIS